MKIREVTAELLQAERQSDREMDRQRSMTKLIAAFRKFSKALKNENYKMTVD
jgi:hypothetical protein